MPDQPETRHRALGAALLYGLLGSIWILFSDQALEWLTDDPKLIVLISALKGLAFVAVTAFALWWLLLGVDGRRGVADARDARHPWQPILIMGLVLLTLTVAGIFLVLRQEEARSLAQLRAIADLKSRQLTEWLREREEDAELIAGARHFAEDYQRWRQRPDAASGERLRQDLGEFVRFTGFHGAQILGAASEPLFRDSKSPPVALSPVLNDAVARARKEGGPIHVGPYRAADGRTHLDFVVPLPASGDGTVLVLHIDPVQALYPLLQTWPEPSASGEVVWFRRVGDDVLFLNELRHRAGMAASLRLPMSGSRALAVQLLLGEVEPGQAVKGVDYRGVPVFGVARAVPGSDWYVLAKVDVAELYAGVYREAAWVVLASLLALFALGIGAHLARQRRDLVIAERVRQSQAERLRALNLLAAIADSSTDAIFAKDREGRFILFNQAAERLTGMTPDEVLGRDETILFSPEVARRQLADNRMVVEEDRTLTVQETVDTPDGLRVLLTTKGPLHDREGQIIGLYGIARDITERERVQMALRRQLELNQRYLDTVQTVMVALDGEGRVTMINRKGCELLGYAEAELLGRNWFETCLPRPEGMEEVYPVFRRIMMGELDTAEYFENVILCRDGRQRLIAWHNAYFIDETGRISGTLSSGEDITEKRDDEVALHERNAELERFNRTMVGRELDMIELKRRVNELSRELGREAPYSLSGLETSAPSEGES